MHTEELMNALKQTTDFDHLCERKPDVFMDETLIEYLQVLLTRHGASKCDLIDRADLEKGYTYQILRGLRTPGRDKLIQIALGLTCTLEETQMLLRLGGRNELYSRVRRDAAILFCLLRHYSVAACQAFLVSRHLGALRD